MQTAYYGYLRMSFLLFLSGSLLGSSPSGLAFIFVRVINEPTAAAIAHGLDKCFGCSREIAFHHQSPSHTSGLNKVWHLMRFTGRFLKRCSAWPVQISKYLTLTMPSSKAKERQPRRVQSHRGCYSEEVKLLHLYII